MNHIASCDVVRETKKTGMENARRRERSLKGLNGMSGLLNNRACLMVQRTDEGLVRSYLELLELRKLLRIAQCGRSVTPFEGISKPDCLRDVLSAVGRAAQ